MRTYRLVADFPWPEWHTGEKPDVIVGQAVYQYKGPTYGCISPDEIAVSLAPGEGPFYGIPKSALEQWPGKTAMAAARAQGGGRATAFRMIADEFEEDWS